MVNDLVMDATLQAHQEVLRSRTLCPVCHTCFATIPHIFPCRPPSDAGRSPSPPSDAGGASDESPKGKAKGKAANKRTGA
ncbi:hypothetical protein H0H87_005865 [Tephrocybe sp. NHM501043]|nr:hypothetical protein H0H87_005865 [Tephrocybe sp. NHM501043]